ncbi:PREDICTED: uncharacterized protein LOC109337512 [Lupinus angustifolius]|uniref:uncharacterized protein LOC109337512 n=1 Tax=Lupinus angustifolius TaxID=3871 RepID=UPI00092E3320|nr:PREDICTED: uncharacterized protein LOC109337512 [Lupinus angustifolius]
MTKNSNNLGTTRMKSFKQKPVISWSCLANLDESAHAEVTKAPDPAPPISEVHKNESFAQALKATCDISISQLPQPCIKGDAIAIKIPEEEYQAGLQRCKSHLHGRLILSKGDSPLRFTELRTKLQALWNMIGTWGMISLGRGYYEFSFASVDDMRILFSIAGGLGVPISLDDATSSRSFGHFARILVDVDLKGSLPSQILVEREGFAFSVDIEYENLPDFCSGCQSIGHLLSTCRRNKEVGVDLPRFKKDTTIGKTLKAMNDRGPAPNNGHKVISKSSELDKSKEVVKDTMENDLVIELEFENNVNLQPDQAQKEGPPNPNEEASDLHSSSDDDTRDTTVEETQENEDIQLILEERYIVQKHGQMSNVLAAKETRIVGRLWADQEEDITEELEENSIAKNTAKEGTYTKVLSKSQKKKLRQKQSLEKDNKLAFICAVYAHTNYMMRRTLWSEILSLISTNKGPWCCIGDFNSILGANECKGSYLPNRLACEDFQRFSEDGRLHHILTSGAEFTWKNRRRGLAHTEKSKVIVALCLDLLIMFGFCNEDARVQLQFRFHKMWLKHEGLRGVIEAHWANRVVGFPMYILASKLKGLKAILKVWNNEVFGNIHIRVKEAFKNLEDLQLRITNEGQSDTLMIQEDQAQKHLLGALIAKEEFWKEKSRLNWKIRGDRNTAFFHNIAKIRYATKSMCILRHGEETLLHRQEIDNHVLSYFINLYASENVTQPSNLIDYVIPKLVTQEENTMLSRIPLEDEIRDAVFAKNGEGAPGPDGFGGCFFQEFWDIVGADMCHSVNHFFTQGWILPNLNSNNLILIPKFPSADKIEDFRPIALANFQFKIITKVLADRLAKIAHKIISQHQRGFIKDRHIHDCICIASEANNLLDHKTLGGNLALKPDVKKAFDTIDWRFLMDTLKAFGFHKSFIHWIEVILNSAKLSISVNGRTVGYFSCKRGVRQGDPLSPLLLCLAEEVISRGLTKLLEKGKFRSIVGPRIATPSHVLYADDILVFCRGIKRDLLAIKKLFNDYANVSGQCLNLSKCKFFSTQANTRKIGKLTSWLGFGVGSLPFNYLGVPVFQGKPRVIHLQPITDRIINKLAKWKGCCLLIMGRVELGQEACNSCLAQSLLSNQRRGLGIRSIKLLNEAAMLKLAWEMNSSEQEWATYYKSRLCRNKEPKSSYIKSSIWPGIRKHWQVILDNSIWLFGNGNNIRYWRDNWLGKTLVDLLGIPNQISSALLARIPDFIHHSTWIIPSWLSRINPEVCQSILRTLIPATHLPDKLAWMHTNDGILSSK